MVTDDKKENGSTVPVEDPDTCNDLLQEGETVEIEGEEGESEIEGEELDDTPSDTDPLLHEGWEVYEVG